MIGVRTGRFYRWRATLGLLLGVAVMLSSCAHQGRQAASESVESAMSARQPTAMSQIGTAGRPAAVPSRRSDTGAAAGTDVPGGETADLAFYEPGSGHYVRAPRRGIGGADEQAGDLTLNFENTSLLEVVQLILGDMLITNYVVDPRVQGRVTLQTSRPMRREGLLDVLETVLQLNGAVLIRDPDLYRIVPLAEGVKKGPVPDVGRRLAASAQGFGIQVVPLRFIAAEEMKGLLEPIARPGNILRVDPRRNLILLAGSQSELRRLLSTVEIFDVDWLAGRSVALFTPAYVDAKTLADELEPILGETAKSAKGSLVRIEVIDRLNGLLVVAKRPEQLKQVRKWVERLDQETGGAGRRLFIYHVQNGKAAELADVLSKVFEQESSQKTPARLAPGLSQTVMRSEAAQTGTEGDGGARPTARPGREGGGGEGLILDDNTRIKVIPDEVNNALLIMATRSEFRLVQAALRKLDITPLQVLIEATIAEITLSDELQYGLEWFFKNHIGNSKGGVGTLDLGTGGLAALAPGFSYAVSDAAGAVRAVFNTLASQSKLHIISSPSIMVLNNQKASIQVGDQVPIITQQQQSTNTNSNLVNTIEYRDTGVLLSVTPRVNAGGLVTMEVEQEVSSVRTDVTGDNPTISQRKVVSTVAVQSGQTVVLGGLIRGQQDQAESGVPGLHEIPVLGGLFGSSRDDTERTELVVLITPRAVQSSEEAQAATDEYRERMESLKADFDMPTSRSVGQRKRAFRLDTDLGGR